MKSIRRRALALVATAAILAACEKAPTPFTSASPEPWPTMTYVPLREDIIGIWRTARGDRIEFRDHGLAVTSGFGNCAWGMSLKGGADLLCTGDNIVGATLVTGEPNKGVLEVTKTGGAKETMPIRRDH